MRYFVNVVIICFLQSFLRFTFLWEEDRYEVVSKLIATTPDLQSFKEAYQKYENYEKQINSLSDVVVVGSVAIHTGNFNITILGFLVVAISFDDYFHFQNLKIIYKAEKYIRAKLHTNLKYLIYIRWLL